MIDKTPIINDDSALPIPRQLARWLGWNEAGILQQLHWHTGQGHGQIVDGVRWIRMSETEWMEEIPLDEKAIQRAIKNLIGDGLVRATVFSGRCKWYAVCYDAIGTLSGPVDRIAQKSEKRKQARATRKDTKELVVSVTPEDNDAAKEQIVPIEKEGVKVQNVGSIGTKCPPEWVQNVPLQNTNQNTNQKDLLLLSRAHDEILDRIGILCKTNFFNPFHEPGRKALLSACQEYTASKVLWAIELALSPEKANGKPKTWGFVLGILKKDKEGSYYTPNNGATNGAYKSSSQSAANKLRKIVDLATKREYWVDGYGNEVPTPVS